MPYKVTSEIISIIKKDYLTIGCYQLAKNLKLDPKTIYLHAKKMNLPGPTKKFTAEYITKTCETCNKEFQKRKCSITKNQPAKYCSKLCANTGRRKGNSKLNTVMNLIEQGLKNREISKITGYPMGSIASILNRAKFRREKEYSNNKYNLRKIYKNCQICGFDRIVEIAHIIPARNGGKLTEDNTVGLCPNHHYLFDHNKLTDKEYTYIKEKVEKIQNAR